MLAKAMAGILPEMELEEQIELSKIYSEHDYYLEISPLLNAVHLGLFIIPLVKPLSLVDEEMLDPVRYHLHTNEFFFWMNSLNLVNLFLKL